MRSLVILTGCLLLSAVATNASYDQEFARFDDDEDYSGAVLPEQELRDAGLDAAYDPDALEHAEEEESAGRHFNAQSSGNSQKKNKKEKKGGRKCKYFEDN